MGLTVHLLGRPSAARDGESLHTVRGRKAWALLAYLVCSRGAATREQLAQLLFGEAADPLGALRWNLAEVRRLLGDPDWLKGEVLRHEPPAGAYIDVSVLTLGTWHEAVQIPGLGRDLLEGMSFGSCPAFEAWLLTERRHLQAAAEAVLREAAYARLAAGEWPAAVSLATRLIALNPLSDSHQALLIRSHAAHGDMAAATRQRAACIELFDRELGVDPGPEVMRALEQQAEVIAGHTVTGSASAAAQLEAGEAAVYAGTIDAGLVCLRRAIAESHVAGDGELEARSLLAYGSALVHAARGRSEEATTALQRCILVAGAVGAPDIAAGADGELAWLELLAGRYERAEVALSRAAARLGPGSPRWISVHFGVGACRLAQGRYGEAIDLLRLALRQAEEVGDLELTVQCLTQLGLARLLRREIGEARELIERAVELCRSARLINLIPYPESLLAEVELVCGDLGKATELFERAFALGCQLGDPCWEGLSRRGLGLLAASRGEFDDAIAVLEDAYVRAGRHPDSDKWIVAYILDALCSVAIEAGRAAHGHVNDLESLAARTGMCELLVRSYRHRSRLGDPSALDVARLLATGVDNPYLHALLMDS